MGEDDDTIGAKRRRVTAQMVADAAGVSRSAVSRAFTEGAPVDARKRLHIRAVAAELGYQPNALAAGLKAGQSNLIAIFVGDMRSPYDMDFVRHLVTTLNGLRKCPILIDGADEGALGAAEAVLRYPLDALILRGGSMSADIVTRCTQFGIPMISSGRPVFAPGVDNVCCRNGDGSRAMVQLLLAQGRRRFGFIGGPETFYSSGERRAGAVAGLAEAGLAFVAETTSDFTVDGGHAAANALLRDHHLDALVCANDATAIGALSAAQELGQAVPEELSVTGFDDIAMAKWPTFNLTTVRNPIDRAVDQIIGLLDRRLADAMKPDELIYLDPEVIARRTH